MRKELEILDYDVSKGIQLSWEDNFEIKVIQEENEVLILANTEGLISLAKHLLTLAQSEVPQGKHIHLDHYNSLEMGSIDLIIEKSNGG